MGFNDTVRTIIAQIICKHNNETLYYNQNTKKKLL